MGYEVYEMLMREINLRIPFEGLTFNRLLFVRGARVYIPEVFSVGGV